MIRCHPTVRRWKPAALLILATAFAAAVRAEIVVIDDSGATIRLARPAQRILSLAPHVTENLFAIGAGERIVGTVDFSDYPAEAARLPRVGGYSHFDVEAAAALRPDLIIAWESGNPKAQVEKLKVLGVPIYLTQPNRIEDIPASLERLGALAGVPASAAAEASDFRRRLDGLRDRYAARPVVRAFYQVWNTPLMTVGRDQIITDAMRICGAQNVFDHLTTMAPNVSVEAVLAANPEVIIASGPDGSRPGWLDDWRRWPRLDAVVRNNLFHIPPQLIQRHTVRILDGTAQLCEHLDTARARRGNDAPPGSGR